MLSWFRKSSKVEMPKTLGQIGEELAQLEYKRNGYKIVTANYFNRKGKRLGEIDFIAKDKHCLIFAEVKTRTDDYSRFGRAVESVNVFKQVKLLKAAKIFLLRNPKLAELKPQIDVCLIRLTDISSLKLVKLNPAEYLAPGGVDKIGRNVKIIPNAVEDWS